MAQNNFKPFATGNNANVISQVDYEALAALLSGFTAGKASAAQINKALRQGTVMSFVLAQFIADLSGKDVLDNGDVATISTNLIAALKANGANSFLQKTNNFSDLADKPTARSNLGLGGLATKDSLNASDVGAISAQGGNYSAILRMSGIETLATEPAAGNLSALYSAQSPVPPNSIASGTVHNWYGTQIMTGIVRNASTGVNGWGIFFNGVLKFIVDPNGNVYAGGTNKLATESYAAPVAGSAGQVFSVAAATADNHAVNLSKLNAAISALSLGSASKANIGTGSGQIPDMSAFGNASSANSGYVKLPDGTIIQRGFTPGGVKGSPIDTSFPIPFTSNNYSVVATSDQAKPGSTIVVNFATQIVNNSVFRIMQDTDVAGYSAYWIAVGK